MLWKKFKKQNKVSALISFPVNVLFQLIQVTRSKNMNSDSIVLRFISLAVTSHQSS